MAKVTKSEIDCGNLKVRMEKGLKDGRIRGKKLLPLQMESVKGCKLRATSLYGRNLNVSVKPLATKLVGRAIAQEPTLIKSCN